MVLAAASTLPSDRATPTGLQRPSRGPDPTACRSSARRLASVAVLVAAAAGLPAPPAAAAPVLGGAGGPARAAAAPLADPPPCPLPTLRQGDTGSAVVRLQRLVGATADGIFGPITRSAVVAAQQRHGLPGTGVVDTATWRALAASCSTTTATTRTRLDGQLRSYPATRPSTVSVAVYDARSGATYSYRGPAAYDTASIVKVQVLGTLLRQAAAQQRTLTAGERSLASLTIRNSDNDATTQLWNRVGGGAAVAAFDRSLGLASTVPGPGGYWGLTTTTATDQLRLLRNMAYGSTVLSSTDRAYVRSLMGSVVSWQRWGVSGGVPAGVTVELKNGWLPRATHGWRVHSIGHVQGQGRDCVLAVLSQDDATMDVGVQTLQGVSALVWRTLADPPV